VVIEVSSDGGTSWSSLAERPGLSGAQSVELPASQGTLLVRARATTRLGRTHHAMLRLPVDDAAPVARFADIPEEVTAGDAVEIAWWADDANFGEAPILIDVSTDGGTTWEAISAALPARPGFLKTVIGRVPGACRLRLRATDLAGWETLTVSPTIRISPR
jgi:hypothetical protein